MNSEITYPQVRLIDAEGHNHGVVSLEDAKKVAEESDLDLVVLSPDTSPPVCRVMDYGKFKFNRDKKAQQSRKKQKHIQVKEIKFRPRTDERDYQTKLKSLVKFLNDGDKTKVTVRFRGREMAHQDRGLTMLKRVESDLHEYGSVEQHPKQEGRQITLVLAPLKNNKAIAK